MGLNAPLNRTVNYKLDNEVAADLQTVYIDDTEYLQLTSKTGNILSQFPFTPVMGNAAITADITVEIDLGGLVAGTTIPAGTTITDLFRYLLHVPNYFVGFIAKTKAQLAEMTDADFLSVIKTGVLSQGSLADSTAYSYTAGEELGVLFVLVDSNTTFSANYSSASELSETSWIWDEIAAVTTSSGDAASWFIRSADSETTRRGVTLNNRTYDVYGYYNSTWQSADKMSLTFSQPISVNEN